MSNYAHLRVYQHVAQKEHWCDRCCTHIQPGDMYEGHVEINRGRLVVIKYHINPSCDYPEDPEDIKEMDKEQARKREKFNNLEKSLRKAA